MNCTTEMRLKVITPFPDFCRNFLPLKGDSLSPELMRSTHVVKVLQCIHRRAKKLVEGLEWTYCEEQLRTMGLSCLEE